MPPMAAAAPDSEYRIPRVGTCEVAGDPGLAPTVVPPLPPAMAAEQPSEKKKPQPEKKGALPKVVTLNKALKLAQTWVDKMSAPESDEPNDKDFEGRPARLGLGAKLALNAKRAAPTDPVERRLLEKVNAQKRKSAEEENKTAHEGNEASDDDSGEPEGRTSAFSKKRTWPSVTAMPLGKKAK